MVKSTGCQRHQSSRWRVYAHLRQRRGQLMAMAMRRRSSPMLAINLYAYDRLLLRPDDIAVEIAVTTAAPDRFHGR